MMMRRGLLIGAALLVAGGIAHGQTKKAAGNNDSTAREIAIDGAYRSDGRNADGSAYDGRVQIVQQGEAVEFTWNIGSDVFRGAGTIEGRVVTVDWGDSSPVIYVVMTDGELHGTWADGTALEKLTPQ